MKEYQETVLNSKILAVKFRELCREFEPPVYRKNSERNARIKGNNIRVINFLHQLSKLFKKGKCDSEAFHKEILKIDCLELEILWYLQICEVISLAQYVAMHESIRNENVIKNISTNVIQRCMDYKLHESNYFKEIIAEFLIVIFNHEQSLYCHFTNSIIDEMKKSEEFNEIFVFEFLNSLPINKDLVKKFLMNVLKALLIRKESNIQDIVPLQQYYKEKDLNGKGEFFKFIFEYFNSDEIFFIISEVVSNHPNWENLLIFISHYAVTYKDGFIHLKNLISNLINQSFQNSDERSLASAFLLARQCCFHKNSLFPSYLQWFSSTFSSESSRPINTKQNCEFFFNFLNNLVECDLPCYLRIHINRVPHVPIDCQSILSDYIKLVKTRLFDLNESIELGFFENTGEKSSAEYDVQYALELFENNNEIPHCILEANLFNRAYYEKKFIPQLVSKFDGKSSTRHKFIVKLHSLGKIANSVFINYKHLTCTDF